MNLGNPTPPFGVFTRHATSVDFAYSKTFGEGSNADPLLAQAAHFGNILLGQFSVRVHALGYSGSLNVSPRVPTENLPNGAPAYAVFYGQSIFRLSPISISLADCSNNLLGQFRLWMRRAMTYSLARTGIRHIFLLASESKVIWSDTCTVITGMKHIHARRNRFNTESIGNSVSGFMSPSRSFPAHNAHGKVAVPCSHLHPSPQPAFLGFLNLTPKSRHSGFWHRLVFAPDRHWFASKALHTITASIFSGLCQGPMQLAYGRGA